MTRPEAGQACGSSVHRSILIVLKTQVWGWNNHSTSFIFFVRLHLLLPLTVEATTTMVYPKICKNVISPLLSSFSVDSEMMMRRTQTAQIGNRAK